MVQISILLNKSKIVEIWSKFFISRAILKAQKRQTTFWKWQDKGNFVIIIFRNLLLKLGWQINAANYIKNQDDIQVVLHTVMFRALYHYTKSKHYLKRRYRIRHWIPMFIGTPCRLKRYFMWTNLQTSCRTSLQKIGKVQWSKAFATTLHWKKRFLKKLKT